MNNEPFKHPKPYILSVPGIRQAYENAKKDNSIEVELVVDKDPRRDIVDGVYKSSIMGVGGKYVNVFTSFKVPVKNDELTLRIFTTGFIVKPSYPHTMRRLADHFRVQGEYVSIQGEQEYSPVHVFENDIDALYALAEYYNAQPLQGREVAERVFPAEDTWLRGVVQHKIIVDNLVSGPQPEDIVYDVEDVLEQLEVALSEDKVQVITQSTQPRLIDGVKQYETEFLLRFPFSSARGEETVAIPVDGCRHNAEFTEFESYVLEGTEQNKYVTLMVQDTQYPLPGTAYLVPGMGSSRRFISRSDLATIILSEILAGSKYLHLTKTGLIKDARARVAQHITKHPDSKSFTLTYP